MDGGALGVEGPHTRSAALGLALLVIQNETFVLVERHEIKVEILKAVLFQQVLAAQHIA